MSLRTDIQTRIIQALKGGNYPVVTYSSSGLPVTGTQTLVPEVVCNEIEGQIVRAGGSGSGYVMQGWVFEALVKFSKEVDVTDSLMDFSLSYVYTDPTDSSKTYAVMIVFNSQYTSEHPVTQGSHTGTRVKLSFIVNIKK